MSRQSTAVLLASSRVFTPVLAKHSKSFSVVDAISVGVDRMQRNFEPMRKQVELWWQSELTDITAKMIISPWTYLVRLLSLLLILAAILRKNYSGK